MICMCRSIRTARRFIAHDCAKCCHSGIRKAGANVLLLGSFRCTRPEGLSCRHDPSDGADRSLPQRRRRHALLALLLSWSDADELSIDFGACVCRMCPMIAIACNHVVVTTRRRCMLSAACRLPHVAFRMGALCPPSPATMRIAPPRLISARADGTGPKPKRRETDNTCAVIAETSPVFACRVAFQA